MSQATHAILGAATSFPGATGIPKIEAALEAINSCHSGASAPSYAVAGTWWWDTNTDILKWYDGTSWISLFKVDTTNHKLTLMLGMEPDEEETSSADTTPSVASKAKVFKSNSNGTVTTFDDASAGQIVYFHIVDTSTTLDGGLTKTGMTIPGQIGDVWIGLYTGSGWEQIGGNVGMGCAVDITPVALTTFIPISATSLTDVDCSSFVRKGAQSVKFYATGAHTSGSNIALYVQKNGTSAIVAVAQNDGGGIATSHIRQLVEAQVDNDAIFEAKWNISTNVSSAVIVGYTI